MALQVCLKSPEPGGDLRERDPQRSHALEDTRTLAPRW